MQKISLFSLKVDNNVHIIIYTKDTSNVLLVYGLYPFVCMHIYNIAITIQQSASVIILKTLHDQITAYRELIV